MKRQEIQPRTRRQTPRFTVNQQRVSRVVRLWNFCRRRNVPQRSRVSSTKKPSICEDSKSSGLNIAVFWLRSERSYRSNR